MTPTRPTRLLAALTAAGTTAGLAAVVAPPAYADVIDPAPRTVLNTTPVIESLSALAVGLGGRTYAAGDDGLGNEVVAVFAADAGPASAPERVITGGNTGFNNISGLAVDKAGFVYVADGDDISIFSKTATGNVAPQRTLFGPGVVELETIALDRRGNMVVGTSSEDSVLVFEAGSTGSDPATRTIAGAATQLDDVDAVTVGRDGSIYAGNEDSVVVFAPGANGNVAPIRRIGGPATLVDDPRLTLDSSGRLYVANDDGDSIATFGAKASGNATPLRVITGPTSNPDSPGGIGLRPNRDISVAIANPVGQIPTYRALHPFTRPGLVRDLKVKNPPRAPRRPVVWKAPTSDGGKPIESYQVTVRFRGAVITSRNVPARNTRTVLKRKALRDGSHTVTVRARTSIGLGPARTKSFAVRK